MLFSRKKTDRTENLSRYFTSYLMKDS